MSANGQRGATLVSANKQPTPPLSRGSSIVSVPWPQVRRALLYHRIQSSSSSSDSTSSLFDSVAQSFLEESTSPSDTVNTLLPAAAHVAPYFRRDLSTDGTGLQQNIDTPATSLFQSLSRSNYSLSRNTGTDSAPSTLKFLGSAALLPGSEALPAAPHSLVDSFTFNLGSQGRQREVGRAMSSQQVPGGVMSKSSGTRATLPYCQPSVAPNYIHPLDRNAPSNVPARLWPEYAQNVLQFLDLNDEGVRNSLLHFRSSTLAHASERTADMDRVKGRDDMFPVQLNSNQKNIKSGDSGQQPVGNFPRVEEHGFTNLSRTQARPKMSTAPQRADLLPSQSTFGFGDHRAPAMQPVPYFGGQVPYYGHANPYYGSFDPNYGPQNPYYGDLSHYYAVQNPYYRPQNAYCGDFHPYYGHQNAIMGSRQDMTMPRQNMSAIGGQNIPTMARQNMQAMGSHMPGSLWIGAAEGGYGRHSLTAEHKPQYQYGRLETDETARRQGVPMGPNRGMNNFLHAPRPRPRDMRTQIAHWGENLPTAGSHYYGPPMVPGASEPASLHTFDGPQVSSGQRMRSIRGGRGAERGRTYASGYYNQG
jgi:hypothetical protein